MVQIIFCYDTLIVTHSLLGTEPYYSPPPLIPADGGCCATLMGYYTLFVSQSLMDQNCIIGPPPHNHRQRVLVYSRVLGTIANYQCPYGRSPMIICCHSMCSHIQVWLGLSRIFNLDASPIAMPIRKQLCYRIPSDHISAVTYEVEHDASLLLIRLGSPHHSHHPHHSEIRDVECLVQSICDIYIGTYGHVYNTYPGTNTYITQQTQSKPELLVGAASITKYSHDLPLILRVLERHQMRKFFTHSFTKHTSAKQMSPQRIEVPV